LAIDKFKTENPKQDLGNLACSSPFIENLKPKKVLGAKHQTAVSMRVCNILGTALYYFSLFAQPDHATVLLVITDQVNSENWGNQIFIYIGRTYFLDGVIC
jgi:hypothetical protein